MNYKTWAVGIYIQISCSIEGKRWRRRAPESHTHTSVSFHKTPGVDKNCNQNKPWALDLNICKRVRAYSRITQLDSLILHNNCLISSRQNCATRQPIVPSNGHPMNSESNISVLQQKPWRFCWYILQPVPGDPLSWRVVTTLIKHTQSSSPGLLENCRQVCWSRLEILSRSWSPGAGLKTSVLKYLSRCSILKLHTATTKHIMLLLYLRCHEKRQIHSYIFFTHSSYFLGKQASCSWI